MSFFSCLYCLLQGALYALHCMTVGSDNLMAVDGAGEEEVYQHLYPADLERQQTIMLNLPDERTYTCTVYQDDEPQEPFVIER